MPRKCEAGKGFTCAHRQKGCIFLAAVFLIAFPSYASSKGFERYQRITKYDKYFKKYSKRYFGVAFDWRYFKAQAVAESGLMKDSNSHAGAMGIMQLLPTTFQEIAQSNPNIKREIRDPRWNIAAGIYYDKELWSFWYAERPFGDRLNFMFASYNAGKYNILKAQKIAEKRGLEPVLWHSIKRVLPEVTGRGSRETIRYIKKIHKIREDLH